MKTAHKRREPIDLTQGPCWKVILLFSLPVILSYLLQQVYSISDAAIVGQTLTAAEVAGVNDTNSLVFIFLQFAFGVSAGFCVITSYYVGMHDERGVRRSLATQLLLSAALTVVLTALALGGAALSLKKPTQNHNLMRLPSFRGVAEVRASLPGRMRLYLPAVSANREAAEEMKRQLEATGVVHEVTLNFRLSSALIRYDETKVEAAVVQGAVLKLMGLSDALQKEPVSRIQSGLNTLMAAINHGLLEATNGLLDVRTLAGCALTFAGVKSLAVSGAAVPGAMTLLWWAASIWRRNDSGTN
mgnify:CR=1 FL=1